MSASNSASLERHDRRLRVAYIRVSTDKDDQRTSLLEQERVARDEWQVDQIFTEVYSAKNPGKRSQFEAMVELIEAGEVKEVRAKMLDRLSRNDSDLQRLREAAALRQCRVLVDECSDLAAQDSTTETMVAMTGFLAEQYSMVQRQKALATNASKRKRGITTTCRPPFGYQLNADKTKLEPHPQNWTLAKALWEMLAANEFRVATTLNKWRSENYPPLPIKAAGICSWMNNPALTGDMTYFGRSYRPSEAEKRLGVRDPNRQEKVTHGCHINLVTKSQWLEAQRVLSLRKQGRRTNKNGGNTMFRGYAKCAYCLQPMHFRDMGRRAWRCTNISSDKKCPNCYKTVKEDLISDSCIAAITKVGERIALDLKAYEETVKKSTPEQERIELNLEYLRMAPDPLLVRGQIEQLEEELKALKVSQSSTSDLAASAKVFADPKAWEVLKSLPDSQDRLRAVFMEYIEAVFVDARGGQATPTVSVKLRI
jgi:site-specific DNA recombinase